jgi:hypothetical protein
MEISDLSDAGNLQLAVQKAKALFPSLGDKVLTKEDCRGIFDALCLVHRTRNKSFKNEAVDKPIVSVDLMRVLESK